MFLNHILCCAFPTAVVEDVPPEEENKIEGEEEKQDEEKKEDEDEEEKEKEETEIVSLLKYFYNA